MRKEQEGHDTTRGKEKRGCMGDLTLTLNFGKNYPFSPMLPYKISHQYLTCTVLLTCLHVSWELFTHHVREVCLYANYWRKHSSPLLMHHSSFLQSTILSYAMSIFLYIFMKLPYVKPWFFYAHKW